jgi:hypothetical protein
MRARKRPFSCCVEFFACASQRFVFLLLPLLPPSHTLLPPPPPFYMIVQQLGSTAISEGFTFDVVFFFFSLPLFSDLPSAVCPSTGVPTATFLIIFTGWFAGAHVVLGAAGGEGRDAAAAEDPWGDANGADGDGSCPHTATASKLPPPPPPPRPPPHVSNARALRCNVSAMIFFLYSFSLSAYAPRLSPASARFLASLRAQARECHPIRCGACSSKAQQKVKSDTCGIFVKKNLVPSPTRCPSLPSPLLRTPSPGKRKSAPAPSLQRLKRSHHVRSGAQVRDPAGACAGFGFVD